MTAPPGIRTLCALSVGATLAFLPASAMGDNPPPPTEQKPVEAFGRDNPSCREWTDGCLVCARQADGSAACSTPGIACVPSADACIRSGK